MTEKVGRLVELGELRKSMKIREGGCQEGSAFGVGLERFRNSQ